jgi:energy-coupling factor transporter ATP-binding protein EcfA2
MGAQRRVEEAQQAREKAERDARSWDDRAANAEKARKAADEERQAADRARLAAEERLALGIPPDVRPTAEQVQQSRERLGYGKHALNIALVGESGVGKSALLNAVLGLWPDDPGAAAVGVDETTAEVQGYVDPRHPQVKWFDVPGANTPTISGWLYFMDQNLYIFDVLVILFSDRFTQTIGTLLRNAHQSGIRTFLVRTKADQLIQNLKTERRTRRPNYAQIKKKFIDDTQAMVYNNLMKLGLPLQPVFIVSVTGMRELVTEGDITNVIDEQVVYQTLFPESQLPTPESTKAESDMWESVDRDVPVARSCIAMFESVEQA